jgi:SAM-dependent MidA family methyltransferase
VRASPDAAASCGERLARLIESDGPIPVAQFMREANRAYYAAGDPLGVAGDFITAPEISQMFGEMVGLCLADLWRRAGAPAAVHYVELGPGRGTLAADALRAMARFGLAPPVHFVETSPALRAKQAEAVASAQWHDALATLPRDAPLLVVANEFFDALPIRQFVKTIAGWRERMVSFGPDGFVPVPGTTPYDALIPARLSGANPGSIVEAAPAVAAVAGPLARRLARQGGAALIIDYGYARRAAGDTLQAVHAHAYADPFALPGRSDLTAHVDFGALADAAAGAEAIGPVDQGAWLQSLGIARRAEALAAAAPTRHEEIMAALHRLTAEEEMGTLFKVLALTAPGWPAPAGFA